MRKIINKGINHYFDDMVPIADKDSWAAFGFRTVGVLVFAALNYGVFYYLGFVHWGIGNEHAATLEHAFPEDRASGGVDSGDGIDVGHQQLGLAMDHGEVGRRVGALAHFLAGLARSDQGSPHALAGLLVDLDERVGRLHEDSVLDDQWRADESEFGQ